tara:strand:- start:7874 stop:8761 length:888 start_codon:yes stop_codon:yes gene_type:complete
MNNHDILGTNDSWSQRSIRKQFKLLSIKIHPDKSGTSELFKIVHIAYKNVMGGKGNEHFVYLPSEVIASDESIQDPESLRIQIQSLLEDIRIKTECLVEANAQIRKLTAHSDVSKIAGQLKFALSTLFIVMVIGAILLMTTFNQEQESIIPTPRFFISSMPETLPVKPKILLKSKKRDWAGVTGYSKAGDFGDFILITELGIPTIMFQIDKTLYSNEEKAKLRNEKHGSCEAALSVNKYQKVGLINPFARATVDEHFVFSIWLFDSVDLAVFKDFEVLTIICDDLKYSAKLVLAE